MKKILFVCLGNICRSPLAEGIMLHKVNQRGLSGEFKIDSCGTAGYHIGELPDPRTRENAEGHGITLVHRARQFKKSDFQEFDVILAMDKNNLRNIHSLAPDEMAAKKARLIREYDPVAPGADVPDPYYDGPQGFEEVYRILDRTIENWLKNNT